MPPTNNATEAEVEWFYEVLQDLLELTPKNVSFWNIVFMFLDIYPGIEFLDHMIVLD